MPAHAGLLGGETPAAPPTVSAYLARSRELPLAQPRIRRESDGEAEPSDVAATISAVSLASALGAPSGPVISASSPIMATRQALPLATPPVLRMPSAPIVQRAEVGPQAAASTVVAAVDESEPAPPDLEALAHDVLPRIKRLLAIERERMPMW